MTDNLWSWRPRWMQVVICAHKCRTSNVFLCRMSPNFDESVHSCGTCILWKLSRISKSTYLSTEFMLVVRRWMGYGRNERSRGGLIPDWCIVLFALVKMTTAILRGILECVEEVHPHFHTCLWWAQWHFFFFGMVLIRKEYEAKDVQDVPPHEH